MARRKVPPPSINRLRHLLSYNPRTGVFVWRNGETSMQKARDGLRAGAVYSTTGYRVIGLDGNKYTAARLAWFYIYEQWPDQEMDHINMIRDDDRIMNLRPATSSQNKINRHPFSNKVGLVGVSKINSNKYMARIKENGRTKYLGLFDTAEAAHAAYKKKALQMYGEFVRV